MLPSNTLKESRACVHLWKQLRVVAACFLLGAILVMHCGCTKEREAETNESRPPTAKNAYVFGEVVDFGYDGYAKRYERGGWGVPEDEFTSSNGRSATLALIVPASSHLLKLRMRLAGVTFESLRFQPIEVLANNEWIAYWEVADVNDYFAVIPPTIANHVELILQLRMPKAFTPRVMGIGDDSHMLGVRCYELSISEVP